MVLVAVVGDWWPGMLVGSGGWVANSGQWGVKVSWWVLGKSENEMTTNESVNVKRKKRRILNKNNHDWWSVVVGDWKLGTLVR